jgi:hypothetical protein
VAWKILITRKSLTLFFIFLGHSRIECHCSFMVLFAFLHSRPHFCLFAHKKKNKTVGEKINKTTWRHRIERESVFS